MEVFKVFLLEHDKLHLLNDGGNEIKINKEMSERRGEAGRSQS